VERPNPSEVKDRVRAIPSQYWCLIKHDPRTIGMHARYAHFLDYGDPADFHETQARLRLELSCEDCQSLDAHPVTKEPNQ
jgi:hypothetical protein